MRKTDVADWQPPVRLCEQLVALARTVATLSQLPREAEVEADSAELADDRPVQIWFDESFIYLSVRCPETVGSEADVYLGNGQAFLRVERSRIGPQSGRPRTPSKLVLGPVC